MKESKPLLKKIHCSACASTKLDIRGKYYQCQHCRTKFTIEVENTKLWYFLLPLLLLMAYFFMPKDAHEPKIIAKPLKIIKPWHKMYPKDIVSSIGDIQRTHDKTYLISGENRSQDTWFTEIDREGKTIWEKYYPNNINGRTRVLALKDGYILSQKRANDAGKTFYLNKARQTIQTFPYYFSAIEEVENGFVGTHKNMIMRCDNQGEILWKKVLDKSRSVRGSRVERTSKGDIKSKIFKNNLILDQLVTLKDGDLVAIGRFKRSKLVLIKLTAEGEILWEKSFTQSRLYTVEDAVSTKDGGFIINARGVISILKFSKEGKLEFKTRIGEYPSSYARTIIETKDGYLSTNQINKGADILLVKLDLQGHIIEDEIYKSNKRLHANHIVHSYDGGYLLSVGTEIYNPWLIKINADAKINVDFSKEIKTSSQTKNKQNLKARIEIVKDSFDYLGGGLNSIIPSKDGKLLYTLTSATGFKIFDISDRNAVKEIANFTKSKLKLRVTANRISPIGRKYAGEGDLAYDSPYDCKISKDEKRAYIVDRNHGFYILDISDKTNPTLLGENKSLIGSSFALSDDEKTVYLVVHDRVKEIDISNFKALKIKTLSYEAEWEQGIAEILLSASQEILYISDVRQVVMYDIKAQSIIERIDTQGRIHGINLSEDKKSLYISNSLGFYGYDIQGSKGMKEKFEIDYKQRAKSFVVSIDEKYLYLSSDSGTKALNIEDKYNPKIETIYSNPSRSDVSVTSTSVDRKTLYIGFTREAIGRVKL